MKLKRTYLCVYFPHWATDVTERLIAARTKKEDLVPDSRAIVLTVRVANQMVVRRASKLARSAGIRVGMTLSHATALCPNVQTSEFDPIRDFKALHTLAAWFLKFSPLVGLDYELLQGCTQNNLIAIHPLHYGLTVDLTGTARLHGDLSHLAARIDESITRGDPTKARLAIAPTIGSAWALSRFTRTRFIKVNNEPSELTTALGTLPVQALRITREIAAALNDTGIQQIHELLSMPRKALSQRFGKFLLYRLEQCLGDIEERLHTIEAPYTYASYKIFEPPLTHRRSISFAIKHIFNDLFFKLHARHVRARYFLLQLEEVGDTTHSKEFSLATATDDLNHLLTVVEPVIDSLRFFNELRCITITARQIEAATPEQHALAPGADAIVRSQERTQLLNNFSVRLGKERISVAKIHQSFIPERSFSYESAIGDLQTKRKESDPGSTTFSAVATHTPSYSINERPTHLCPYPERITTIAMLPDKPPSLIYWRGKQHKIITGIGPERISPEWWSGDLQKEGASERDYFRIQDEYGRWLWVYRDQKNLEWFIHGFWS